MTNSWTDIRNTDLVLIMGGNAAEAHPCGFKWVTEAMQHRKAKLIVVDPRFTRSAAVADVYAPIRVGTDIAFLGGVINYLLSNDKIHLEYAKFNTDLTFLLKPEFSFDNGLFSGYNEERRAYDKSTWGYQIGEDGYVKVDETLQDPLCVYQQLKKHYSRYTPEMVSRICGTPQDKFLQICEMIGETSAPDKVMTIMYALGWTQHSVGSQNIRTMAMIQLLLGNMGRPGGGVNALRGHANVQGITDMNAYSDVLSGYMSAPTDADTNRAEYLARRTLKPLRPNQMSFPQNFPKWHTSLMKAYYGDAATAENDYCYDWIPKRDAGYDVLHIFELMHQGKINGFLVQGFNPIAAVPNKKKLSAALSKLKYLVIMDPLETETSEFWKNYGPLNDVDPATIQTEVFRLPTACFAEEAGTFTNSSRVISWKEKAVDPPGEAKPDSEIIARLFMKLRQLYAKEGGTLPEPIAALTWPYLNPNVPSPVELLREINGRALRDVLAPPDPKNPDAPRAVLVKAGEQLPGFALLQDDGSTACGNWIYSGCFTQAGNMTARRDTSDPSGLGVYPNWGFAWPANRRILYNRASADPSGKPWDPSRTYLYWNGRSWAGADVPDMRPNAKPEEGVGSFIMNPEGVARLHAVGMADGPFPEHYEPFETPVGVNLMCPDNPKAVSNPAARVFKGDLEAFGTKEEFPYAATTYRLTEHHHFWTKHARSNAVVQPAPFVEIGEELAREKGIRQGDKVRVRSNRGEVIAAAVVTRRIKGLHVDGKVIHTVGIPIHWGFKGVTQNGYLANSLTPFVGDANSQTPEFKAFLVNIEKV
ncbi:formate dehydrogenase-N subunit alpha [Caldimonas thermodepolymerans]|jgi:formate dehydrogenase-N alpha subunit|uniref:Formate dehydrogenase (Quinone-dependent) catalytic subunit n=3 Tax=Caldimonas thermodepolymerans TaxID=215580 RepID=A0A2S5T2C3_9BURK|nr:formate dehydrogenase-N subunit alpha [Caldimonas thermodepolymerans]RDH98236.1 formate dehydrogenase (quinone-dependent) catalytic subunit [Caldimonas thermodepolymerans]TCP07987.1 formate dehydrogenase (quinone-dependent) catalytic subunit [Caldimonas thermodepolymerans]